MNMKQFCGGGKISFAWVCWWLLGSLTLTGPESALAAGPPEQRTPVQVTVLAPSVGGPQTQNLTMQLQHFMEVALLRDAVFRLASTNTALNVQLQITNYVTPPSSTETGPGGSKGRVISSGAGGLISVGSSVRDAEGRELKTYLVTENLRPGDAAFAMDRALERLAAQLARFMRTDFREPTRPSADPPPPSAHP